MKTVILCGGRGTRMNGESELRPKPMMLIGGRPILWHIMKTYAHYGHKDFILLLGYKGEQIKEYFRNYRWHDSDVSLRLSPATTPYFHDRGEEGWNITLVETGEDSGTGHRIVRARRHIPDDKPFFLTYGDGLAGVDINTTLLKHQEDKNICTVSAFHPPGRFGELRFNGDKLEQFTEKPAFTSEWVNGGFMVCEPELIDFIGDNQSTMLEQIPMQSLMRCNGLGASRQECFFQPMDTYSEWKHLNALWDSGNAPWKVWD